MLAAQSDSLSLIPGSHIVEGEERQFTLTSCSLTSIETPCHA